MSKIIWAFLLVCIPGISAGVIVGLLAAYLMFLVWPDAVVLFLTGLTTSSIVSWYVVEYCKRFVENPFKRD